MTLNADPVRGNRCPDGFYRGCDFMGCCGLRACGGDGLGCPHPAQDDGPGCGSVGALDPTGPAREAT